MPSITINGAAYNDLTQAFAVGTDFPAAGIYYVLPPYGEPPNETARKYEELVISFPGVDGLGIKRLGFRGRLLRVQLLIAGASKAAAETNHNTVCANVEGLARYDITLPGGTVRHGYRLVPGALTQQWLPSIGGAFICLDTLNFLQCSEN